MKKLLALLIFASIPLAAQVSNPSVRDSATDPTGVACTSAAPILRYTAASTSTMYACTGTGGTTYAALAGSGGTPTALTPNPTIVGQTWGYLPGAAPNQGWTTANALEASITDFGAACDGVTNDNAAWAAAAAAGVGIIVIPPTCTGNSVVSTPLDLSVYWEIKPYAGITYTGTDAGPGIYINGQQIADYPLQVKRGTTTAGQILVEVATGNQWTTSSPGLAVYNKPGSTDNNYISIHFSGAFAPSAVYNWIYTDSPITLDREVALTINSGVINNLNGLAFVSGDPIQFLGSFVGELSLTNTWLYDSNTDPAACFIKLRNDQNEGLQINLHNVFMHTEAGFIGNAICGPTSVIGTDSVNGDFTVNDAHTAHSPTFAVNGQVQGTVVYKQDGVATSVGIVNGIAQSGFFYSAADIPIPTPWFSTAPATSFVSDQTTSCSGTYTSGGAVKCKVWWNGTNWIAY